MHNYWGNTLAVTAVAIYLCCLCDVNFSSLPFGAYKCGGMAWGGERIRKRMVPPTFTLGLTRSTKPRSRTTGLSSFAQISCRQLLQFSSSPPSRPAREQTTSQHTHLGHPSHCFLPLGLFAMKGVFLLLSLPTKSRGPPPANSSVGGDITISLKGLGHMSGQQEHSISCHLTLWGDIIMLIFIEKEI